jgi:hypothetical protein
MTPENAMNILLDKLSAQQAPCGGGDCVKRLR